jgi:hypothetical protein
MGFLQYDFVGLGRGRLGLLLATAVFLAACGGGDGGADSAGGDAPADSAFQAASELPSLGPEATPDVRVLYEGEFEAFGSLSGLEGAEGEGSWRLRLADDFVQLIRPGLEDVSAFTIERGYYQQGMRAQAGPFVVTIASNACPTPTGETLPYTASVLFEDFLYEGCARRGLAQPGEELTWAVDLEALIPAIDACLAAGAGSGAVVTLASIMPPTDSGQALVSVRLRDGSRVRRECLATPDGSQVIGIEVLADADVWTGEGEAEFTRASGRAPAAARCRSVVPVSSAGGTALGWIAQRTC